MSMDEWKGKWVLGLGEMHMLLAALRAAGNAIDDNDLSYAWFETYIYGQIVEAKHMKTALEANITTVQAPYGLYLEECFVDHPHLSGPWTDS